MTGDAFTELGSVADSFDEVELEITEDEFFVILVAETGQGIQQQLIKLIIFLMFGGELLTNSTT